MYRGQLSQEEPHKVGGAPESSQLLRVLVIATATLLLTWLYAIPLLSSEYQVAEPDGNPALSLAGDLQLGERVPAEIRELKFPIVIVVHAECVSCSAKGLERLQKCFQNKDILNLVVAKEADGYHEFVEDYPLANVKFLDPSIAIAMNAAFTPRVYAYDHDAKLVYRQDPNQRLEEAIDAALRTARRN